MADKKTATEVSKTTKKTTAAASTKAATEAKAATKKTATKKTTAKKTTASKSHTTTKAYDDAVKAVIKDYKKKKQITEDDLTSKLVKAVELKSTAIGG